MTLSASDLIAPEGRLQDGLFPDGQITTYVTSWLNRAYEKVNLADIDTDFQDLAAEAYVYYLAYSHVADRLAAEPNSVSIDSAANLSKDVGQDRIAYFRRLAQEYLDQFNQYAETSTFKPPQSAYVQTRVVF